MRGDRPSSALGLVAGEPALDLLRGHAGAGVGIAAGGLGRLLSLLFGLARASVAVVSCVARTLLFVVRL